MKKQVKPIKKAIEKKGYIIEEMLSLLELNEKEKKEPKKAPQPKKNFVPKRKKRIPSRFI